jgi:starvation-inducible DNA-binding protein
MDTRNDLPEDVRKQSCEVLNQILADVSDLYSQTKHAHWNVRGRLFYMQHKLFDEVAESVEEHIDTLAERIVQLGGVARGTVRQTAEQSALDEFPMVQKDELDFTRALADRFCTAAADARKGIDDCEGAGDADSADILTQISRDLDKSLWFLEAQFRPIGQAEEQQFAGRGIRPGK